MSLYLHELNSLLERPLLAGDDGDMGALLCQLDSYSPSETDTSSRQVDMLLWPSLKEGSQQKSKRERRRIVKKTERMALVYWRKLAF